MLLTDSITDQRNGESWRGPYISASANIQNTTQSKNYDAAGSLANSRRCSDAAVAVATWNHGAHYG